MLIATFLFSQLSSKGDIFTTNFKYKMSVFTKHLFTTLFIFFAFSNTILAQPSDTIGFAKGIQVSLLTCGTGPEIYSVFGHSAVRIVDSAAGSDIVYNYGTFDGYDENFEVKFMRGKLMYYISTDNYVDFIDMYFQEGRWVEEQILNTTTENKRKIQQYLLLNMQPENRAYKYDFFYDNCATKIRDIFTQSLDSSFHMANVLQPDRQLTFRKIINQYLANCPWERFGINILLGSKIDKKITNDELLFLPDFLQNAIAKSTLSGLPFSGAKNRLLQEDPNLNGKVSGITYIFVVLLLLTILGNFVPKLQTFGKVINHFWLILTGLLGVLMLFMWFGTDHKPCADNFNLLWALPTNLFFIFRKKQHKYAGIAILCILVSLALHFVGIQQLLLPEMLPLLLSLLIVFRTYYSNAQKLVIQDAKNTTKA